MAVSLLVESKKSGVKVSDAFAEVAKIKGSAEENIQRANAQAANIQANAKVQSIQKWQGVTDKLGKLFANKATEGRIDAGRQKGKELVKKAIETNSFVPRYESEENILGFGKGKKHDEEANKSIDAYNSLLLANTINSAYNQANSEALVPENRQAVMDNLHGVYGGLIEEMEELGDPDLVIKARFLAADKLHALNNDMAKRQHAEMGEKMKGGLITSVATDPTATSVEQHKQQEAAYRLADGELQDRTGSSYLMSISGINAIQKRRVGAFNNVSQKMVSDAITNIVPLMDEQADPTTGFILDDEGIKEIEGELENMESGYVKAALAIGVPVDADKVKEIRYNALAGAARLKYENSIDLEERGLMAGGKYDTQLVEDIMAEEVARGELVVEELSMLISNPLERSEWTEAAKTQLHKFVNDKKDALSTHSVKVENTRRERLTEPVQNALVPATNVLAKENPVNLDDDELGYWIINDFTEALYGDPSGLKPERGLWGLHVSNRMEELGFKFGSREFATYTKLAWKRYNSTIAPFSEIAAANGYKRKQVVISVPQMDGTSIMTDDNGQVKTTPLIIDEDGLNNLSKSPDIIEDASRSILSDPVAHQEAVDSIVKRNNALPLNPSSRFAKMSYALVAGTPYVPEDMDTIDITKNTLFADSVADETGFSLLDSQSYYFLRNLGQRNELQEETEPGAYIDYGDIDKIELEDSFSGDGVFLPLVNGFVPASEEDFNRIFGDDFDGVVDLIKSNPRGFLSSGQIDDTTEAYIRDELDSFWGSNISIKPVSHKNGFSTITYMLFDNENNVVLPGEYTIDLSQRGR